MKEDGAVVSSIFIIAANTSSAFSSDQTRVVRLRYLSLICAGVQGSCQSPRLVSTLAARTSPLTRVMITVAGLKSGNLADMVGSSRTVTLLANAKIVGLGNSITREAMYL